MTDSFWLILCIRQNLMAHRLKIPFTIPKSPGLVVVVARRLGSSLVVFGIRKAMLVATRFSTYFGNSAIPSITSLCGNRYYYYFYIYILIIILLGTYHRSRYYDPRGCHSPLRNFSHQLGRWPRRRTFTPT